MINHLTRMRHPRICVAGIDVDAERHARPITSSASSSWTRADLVENGGPLAVGALVDFSTATPRPSAPEFEDHLVEPRLARRLRTLEADEYLELIEGFSQSSLELIFGAELVRRGWKYAVQPSNGDASLGCLGVRRPCEVEVGRFDRPTLRLNDSSPPAYLPVTDVRLTEVDHEAPRGAAIADLNARMRRGVRTWLMVGLARPWKATDDDRERHWLQVNGICLEDRPVGLLP